MNIKNTMARGDSLKSHDTHLYENPALQYLIILIIIATFIISIIALVNVYQLKKVITPKTVEVDDFLKFPSDLFTKLNKHPELQGLQNQQPIGGQLDQASLNTLKQQFPDVYANAKVRDFLLRYKTKLIIYDYNQDKIINSVDIE